MTVPKRSCRTVDVSESLLNFSEYVWINRMGEGDVRGFGVKNNLEIRRF
jgi:hypothetical protein